MGQARVLAPHSNAEANQDSFPSTLNDPWLHGISVGTHASFKRWLSRGKNQSDFQVLVQDLLPGEWPPWLTWPFRGPIYPAIHVTMMVSEGKGRFVLLCGPLSLHKAKA